jgi:hypothetical protein
MVPTSGKRVRIANPGSIAENGRSMPMAPRSASCITTASVNSLDTDPARYTVCGVAGIFPSRSAPPNPWLHSIDWSSISATLAPTMSAFRIRYWINSDR